MKNLYLMLLMACLCINAVAGSDKNLPAPKVDERVELLSIVFRLAGNSEYSADDNADYVKVIHKHFDRYASHPLIAYAKELHDSSGISYDAVMSMAVHLQQPPSLSPIIPFTKQLPDQRWSAGQGNRFVKLLKKFYNDAGCETFLRRRQAVTPLLNCGLMRCSANWM